METTETKEEKVKNNDVIEQMIKIGAHFGYSRTRRHPSTLPFISMTKDRTDLIDIEKTLNLLKEAVEFVKKLAKEGKIILFVGTKPECKNAIEEAAKSVEMPYVSLRWIGGALTNLPEIKKRVNELKDLKDKKEKGELEKYTKKEQLDIDKKIKKLERNFGGIVNMENKPDALFIVDPKHEHTAVKEAKLLDIPIVSLASSDCDISKIDYPIVANDSAIASISFFVGKIAEAYKEGKENMEIPKEAKTPTKQVEEQKN